MICIWQEIYFMYIQIVHIFICSLFRLVDVYKWCLTTGFFSASQIFSLINGMKYHNFYTLMLLFKHIPQKKGGTNKMNI